MPTGLWTLDSVRQHWLSILRSARLVLVLAAKPDNPHLEMCVMMAWRCQLSWSARIQFHFPWSPQPSVKPLVFSLPTLLLLQDSGCRSVYKLPTKNNFQLDCRYETWGQSVFNNKLIWHRVFPSPHNSTSLLLYLDILSLNWKRKETRTKSLLPSSIHNQDFISIQT